MSPTETSPDSAPQECRADLLALIERASKLEKWPLAQLISIFEVETASSRQQRQMIIQYFDQQPEKLKQQSLILGLTGTPGAGKSSLISTLCLRLLELDPTLTIAVLAIDPSSQGSGGALLGDRTRTQFPTGEKRLFFRSQASDLDLGGVGRKSFQVSRALQRFFDIIIIETVGIGQNETEIQHLSDHTCLVMQPLAGDQIQFIKAGIMEIPDSFIVNKCDEDELARRSYHTLKASLKAAKILSPNGENQNKPIFMTSALKQRGINDLARHIWTVYQNKENRVCRQEQEKFQLEKWIRQEYGQFGFRVYEDDPTQILNQRTYEEKESAFLKKIADKIVNIG